MKFAVSKSLSVIIMLVMLLMFSAPARAGEEHEDEFSLAVVTDIHYLSDSLTDNGPAFMTILSRGDGKVTQYSVPIMEAFVEDMISLSPDALVVTGDLTFNGEKQSHLDLCAAFDRIEEGGTDVYVLPGNHDLNNSMARRYKENELFAAETVTPGEFAQIYHAHGYDDALFRDPASLGYAAKLREGLWLLCIDVNTPEAPGVLTDTSLDWIRDVLEKAEDAGVRVICASHQNLLAHNQIFIDGYRMGSAQSLVETLKEYGVGLNLSGHMHVQHISEEEGITEIVTSAQCIGPCQYGVVTVSGPEWTYETFKVGVARWAKNHNISDPGLLDFEATAVAYFEDLTRRGVLGELSEIAETTGAANLTEETKKRLTEELVSLNSAYFTGRLDTLADFQKILADWQENCGVSFYMVYLLSIAKDPIQNMNIASGSLRISG